MSTAEDLVQFGNSMLYAKQTDHNRNTSGLAIFLIDTEAIKKIKSNNIACSVV